MNSRGDLPHPIGVGGVQANVMLKYSVDPPLPWPQGVAILVTIQAVVAMVTVPVAMVTGLVAIEI